MVFLSSVLFIDVFNLVSYPLIMKLLENEHPIQSQQWYNFISHDIIFIMSDIDLIISKKICSSHCFE